MEKDKGSSLLFSVLLGVNQFSQLNKIMAFDYIKEHLYIGAQRRSTEAIIKKAVLDLELYLWLDIESNELDKLLLFKIPKWVPKRIGLSEDLLWSIARKNMLKSFTCRSLASLLGFEEIEKRLYVIQSADCLTGAAALGFPEVFERFCQKMDEESCYILPSSTQEVIIVPVSRFDFTDPDGLASIVAGINENEVPEKLRLCDTVYFYRRGSGTIIIASGNCKDDERAN